MGGHGETQSSVMDPLTWTYPFGGPLTRNARRAGCCLGCCPTLSLDNIRLDMEVVSRADRV
jgi:hypothetical protein